MLESQVWNFGTISGGSRNWRLRQFICSHKWRMALRKVVTTFQTCANVLFIIAILAIRHKLFMSCAKRSGRGLLEFLPDNSPIPGLFSPVVGQILRGLGVSVCLTPSCDKCWKVGLRISSLRKFGRMRSHWKMATALVVVCQDS
jgi:hypothetical protein